MTSNKKSPLKAKPLRYVGQSLDEEIHKLISEELVFYGIGAALILFVAGHEWWRYYKNPPPSPVIVSIFAILIFVFCVYKFIKIYFKIKLLKLGREGERVVGQYLDDLREKGYRIFHDILGDNFNLDHVIISKKGIFVAETKTYSKPAKGEAKIIFDGESLSIDGFRGQTKPILQVSAASKWLKSVLLESTGKKFSVHPVILFPGWYVESTIQGKKSDVWVLNPKALPAFIENQPEILSQEDLMLAAYHISRYIRTKNYPR